MKKNLAVFCASIIVLTASAEVFAQTRGPRYNPGGGSSSSSSSSTRPTPSSSSSTSSSTSTPQRGPRYNPNPGSSSTSSSTQTTPPRTSSVPSTSSSSTTTPRGPRYNPTPSTQPSRPTTSYHPSPSYPRSTYPSSGPVVRGPRYNPPVSSYSIPSHQGGRVVINRPVYHSPYRVTYSTVRYYDYNDYYRVVNRRYIYRSWLQEPVIFSYSNGYWMIDSYPYYVHRGFRYRYHPVELCNYQLVDSSGYSVSRSFGYTACSISYDRCADERDRLNRNLYSDRYFCAENVGYQYANNNDQDWYGYANDLSYSQESEIDSFLRYKSHLDLFYAGQNYQAGNCTIQNQGYSYVVRVNGHTYPEADINSSDYSAAQMGCNVGSEAENAGCILKAAVQEGYCFQ